MILPRLRKGALTHSVVKNHLPVNIWMDIHLSQCVLAVEEESRELTENYQKETQ